ncbi:MAG: hypothetical protein AAFN30_03550, partial [Actinomycetota bacterium]
SPIAVGSPNARPAGAGGPVGGDELPRLLARLLEMFPTSSIPRMLSGLPTLDRPEQEAAVAAFLAEHEVPSGAKTVEQLQEKQRIQVALRQREADRLAAFLQSSNL